MSGTDVLNAVIGVTSTIAQTRAAFLALPIVDRVLVAAELQWTRPEDYWVLGIDESGNAGPLGAWSIKRDDGIVAGLSRVIAIGIEGLDYAGKRRLVALRRRLEANGTLPPAPPNWKHRAPAFKVAA